MVNWVAEERVLEALACGEPRRVACAAGPMSLKTLSRRFEDPDFVARYELKLAVVASVIDKRIDALAGKATLVAARLLDRHDVPAVQARMVLGLLGLWHQRSGGDVETRLAEVEEVARQQIARFDRIVQICSGDGVPEMPWDTGDRGTQ
jgi:hypothetical protein